MSCFIKYASTAAQTLIGLSGAAVEIRNRQMIRRRKGRAAGSQSRYEEAYTVCNIKDNR